MKFKLLCLVLLGLFICDFSEIAAQSLVVKMKDGSQSSVLTNKLQKMTFEQSNLLLDLKSGAVNTFKLSLIQKLYFAPLPDPVSHTIALSAGWNSLSSYIMPDETDIIVVLENIYPDLIILQTLTEMYYPEGGINTIVNWNSQSAYQIKLSQDVNFTISGQPEQEKTVQLETGWNLMPIIGSNSIDVVTLFSVGGNNLLIVKEVAANAIYWPAFDINTIGNLQPGKAYLVNVSNPIAITFP